MDNKKRKGVYAAGTIVIIMSSLSILRIFDFIYNIVIGGWAKALVFLARTEPFSFVLNPLGYYLFIFKADFLVSVLLVICGAFLLKSKNWARCVLLIYCWINVVSLILLYFLENLFETGMLAVLNLNTISYLSKIPDFKIRYLHSLNPLSKGFNLLFMHWLLPIILYTIFILYFSSSKVKEQFK